VSEFNFQVISPAGKEFDRQVNSAVFPGAEGQLGVRAGHAPLLTVTRPGKISYLIKDEWHSLKLDTEAVLLVNSNRVLLLTQ